MGEQRQCSPRHEHHIVSRTHTACTGHSANLRLAALRPKRLPLLPTVLHWQGARESFAYRCSRCAYLRRPPGFSGKLSELSPGAIAGVSIAAALTLLAAIIAWQAWNRRRTRVGLLGRKPESIDDGLPTDALRTSPFVSQHDLTEHTGSMSKSNLCGKLLCDL